MKDRVVKLAIIATTQHCNNDCEGMRHSSGPMWCQFFNRELVWDEKRLYNGYKRLTVCKKAEQE